jgi:hypothetical protein
MLLLPLSLGHHTRLFLSIADITAQQARLQRLPPHRRRPSSAAAAARRDFWPWQTNTAAAVAAALG